MPDPERRKDIAKVARPVSRALVAVAVLIGIIFLGLLLWQCEFQTLRLKAVERPDAKVAGTPPQSGPVLPSKPAPQASSGGGSGQVGADSGSEKVWRPRKNPSAPRANSSAAPAPASSPSLQPATLAWNTPDGMVMGQSTEVELRVTLDRALFAGLASRMSAPGTTRVEPAELSRHLTATLESTAFEIAPAGPQAQQVLNGHDADWLWVISPKQPGNQTLLLSLLSDFENGPEISSVVRTINVSVAPSPSLFVRTIDFGVKNWDKLLTIVLIPIVAFFWRIHKRRKAAAGEQALPSIDP